MSELMEIKKKFSLEELSELTGISRRTIRFYIQKGLMNGPEGEKRGAYYTTEHLEDLLRIKRMTEGRHRGREASSSSRERHRVLPHLFRRRFDTGC